MHFLLMKSHNNKNNNLIFIFFKSTGFCFSLWFALSLSHIPMMFTTSQECRRPFFTLTKLMWLKENMWRPHVQHRMKPETLNITSSKIQKTYRLGQALIKKRSSWKTLGNTLLSAPTLSPSCLIYIRPTKAMLSLLQWKVCWVSSCFLSSKLFFSPHSVWVSASTELSLTPVLKISPQDNIYEGDTLNITCSVNSSFKDYPGVELFLSQGTELIKRGNTPLHVSWTTPSGAPELTIKCSIFVNTVEKRDNKTLSVNGEQ